MWSFANIGAEFLPPTPGLMGLADTYLGYWNRGGGACGEHSHAINLWQFFSHSLGCGRVTESYCVDGHGQRRSL